MRRKKTIIITVMMIAILFMGAGYALLSSRLDISGSTAVTSTWKVEFSSIRTVQIKGGATNAVTPTVGATIAKFEVDLVQPGDEITYEIDITNYGDIDAEIQGATYSVEGSKAIYVSIDGVRKGTLIGSCEGLQVCPTVTLTLKIGYDSSVEKDPEEKTKDIEVTLDIAQYVEGNPTADGELIPELTESTTLVQQILSNNTIKSDAEIDFRKDIYYISSYTENRGTSTSSITFSSSSTYYYGTGYYFDPATGYFKLSGSTTTGTWSSMSSNYSTYPYTCKSTSNGNCSTIYRMTGYTSTTAGTGYTYTRTANYKVNGEGLFYTNTDTENNMTTYYFRGDVDNNIVKFGKFSQNIIKYRGYGVLSSGSISTSWREYNTLDECNTGYSDGMYTYNGNCSEYVYANAGDDMYWRIVRINEDGSIRIVLFGNSPTAEEGIGQSMYNEAKDSNAYLGYMYGTPGALSYSELHKNVNNSTIKTYIDTWYANNMLSYSSYIADAGFCNNRIVKSGTGLDDVYNQYTANRYTPKFVCPQTNDLFTTSNSGKGNKALTYPVGLLTADEVWYAGWSSNSLYTSYLFFSNDNDFKIFWTNTPSYYYTGSMGAFIAVGGHYMYSSVNINSLALVRPVINLKSTVEVTDAKQDGTATNPYIIKTS